MEKVSMLLTRQIWPQTSKIEQLKATYYPSIMETVCFLFTAFLALPYLTLKEQQDKDISECYQWAVQQSDVNPLDLFKVEGWYLPRYSIYEEP